MRGTHERESWGSVPLDFYVFRFGPLLSRHFARQSDRMAGLFVNVFLHYRAKGRYLLHEFVVMPDHFHLLITPRESLERAMQFIKGGFSFRARKALGFLHEIWQPSFYDRRVRSAGEYFAFRKYIRQNAVRRGLAVSPEDYRYSSAWAGLCWTRYLSG